MTNADSAKGTGSWAPAGESEGHFDLHDPVGWLQAFSWLRYRPGIDALVRRAAWDPPFRAQLLERRSAAAEAAGVTLHGMEKALLDTAPVEQLAALIGAVPAGPPGARLPLGIENLLHRAAADPHLRARVLELRSRAAGPAGVVLKDVEKGILDGVPAAQLAAIIDAMPPVLPQPWPSGAFPPPTGAAADDPVRRERMIRLGLIKPRRSLVFRWFVGLLLVLGLIGLGWLLVHLLR